MFTSSPKRGIECNGLDTAFDTARLKLQISVLLSNKQLAAFELTERYQNVLNRLMIMRIGMKA